MSYLRRISSCQAGKQVGNTHPKKSIMSTSKAFELLHMDLFGPTQYISIGENKHGFVIVDDVAKPPKLYGPHVPVSVS